MARPSSCASAQHGAARHAGEDVVAERLGADRAVHIEDEGCRGRALGDEAVFDHPGLVSAAALGFLLAHGLGEKRGRFDVAPLPANIGEGDHLDPGLGIGVVEQRSALGEGDHRWRHALWVEKVAIGHAAGDLEIDHAFLDLVQRDQLGMKRAELGMAERRGDLHLCERAVEPRQMIFEIERLAAQNRRHLVHAFGEQKRAVEDRDFGVGLRHEAAIHIDDAGHGVGRPPSGRGIGRFDA